MKTVFLLGISFLLHTFIPLNFLSNHQVIYETNGMEMIEMDTTPVPLAVPIPPDNGGLLQEAYDQNLVLEWETEIDKKVFSIVEFNSLSSQRKAPFINNSNSFLVVEDPVEEAKNYFIQQKSN